MTRDAAKNKADLAFDPDQDIDEKRAVRQGYRERIKQLEESNKNPDEYSATSVLNNVKSVGHLFSKVHAPQEAILDSRVLLLASHASEQKARGLKSGSGDFDVDEFVAKLARFMGGQPRAKDHEETQHSDVEGEHTNARTLPLKWHRIGRKALARSRRVPALSFMLGPLSIEQKKRAHVKRQKHEKNDAEETRPQELKEEDIQRSENETSANVKKIGDLIEGEGEVNLFRFFINPKSFAQSVENLFYLSFLIRDGKVAMENREGEPVIYACEAPSEEDYKGGLKKQQLVFEFDMAVWKRAIQVFDIKESMIPDRPPVEMKDGQWY